MSARPWRALFHVEPGETGLVGSLLATSFVLGISLVLLRTSADTLFLVHYRAEQLPYAFFATLLLVPATGVAYSRFHGRLGDTTIAAVGIGLVVVVSALLYPLLTSGGARSAAGFLRVFVEVANAVAALAFWGPVASLLNLRQAKRLYPLIGTGEVAAGILGGVAVAPLVRWLSVEHLVLLSAGFGTVAGALLIATLKANRRLVEEPEDPLPQEGEASRGLLLTVIRDRYLLLIALSYVFYYIAYELLRFTNVAQVEARFELDPAAMATFFGALAAVRTTLVLAVRTFASGRLIARYGLGFGLLSLPVVVIAGAVALLVLALGGVGAALFWAVVALAVVEEVVRTSLNKPAVMLLYRPLTKRRRTVTQTVVETFVNPGATALVGVLILGLSVILAGASPTTKVAALAVLMLVALAALLIVFVLLQREYARAVVDALSRGHLKRTTPPLNQPGAVEVATTYLGSGNAREVLYALHVLEKLVDGDRLIGMIEGLLLHRNLEVRRQALGLVERRRLGALREAVMAREGMEQSPEVLGAWARAIAALDEDEAVKSLGPLLEDPSPDVRHAAIEALLRYAGVDGAVAAGERLQVLAASPDRNQRLEAARIIAAVGLPGYSALLRRLLGDADLEVRRAAIAAIGNTRNLRLLPHALEAVAGRDTGLAATRALVASGPAALPALDALLSDERKPTSAAGRAADALARIGGPEATAILRKHLAHPRRDVRGRVVSALRILGYREPPASFEQIRERLAAEIDEANVLVAARADIADHEPAGILRAALDREIGRSRDFVLNLVALVYPAQPILWARRHLAGHDEDKRAYALEVVETICAKRVRHLFLPLLEESEPAGILRRLPAASRPPRMSAAARVDALAASSPAATDWMRACARHADVEKRNGDPMLLTIERVILLKATDFFSTIEDDVLGEVATMLTEQVAAAGERIIEQGESDSTLYVIVRGMLRVHDGPTIVARLGPGEVVGDLSALDPDVRSVSVSAEEETTLLRMDHSTLMDLIEEHAAVAYGIIRFLVRRCRSTTESAVRLASTPR